MVKGYHLLDKEKYMHKPQMVTQEEINQIYQERLNGVSSFKTNLYPLLTDKNGTQTNHYPIFFVYLPEIVKLESDLRDNSNKIKELSKNLPGIAKQQFLNSLLVSEIAYTNRIEGVETDHGNPGWNDQRISSVDDIAIYHFLPNNFIWPDRSLSSV